MPSTLMYNVATQHLSEVQDADIDRLKDAGWRVVTKHDLVAVYSPTLNEHKTVLRADVKTWINLGYYAEPTMVFHPHEGTRTVSAEEAQYLLQNGWYDSPAKFPKDDANAIVERAVQAFKAEGSTTVAVSKPGPNLAEMTKAQLVEHASQNLGLTLDASQTKAQMLEAIARVAA